MPLRKLHSAEALVHQISGIDNAIPVVYLPGVHGCWTPMDQARPLLAEKLQLVEVAYPLFDSWSLQHYAEALGALLDTLKIDSAHIIGESFGSLVAWQFGMIAPTRIRSHILVGGLCRAPGLFRAATAQAGLSVLPPFAFSMIVDGYIAYKNVKGEPREVSGVKAYPAVRESRGQKATANRMRLIQQTDFRQQLSTVRFPVRYIGGSRDRVVPVSREVHTLEQELPESSSFKSHLLVNAPHAILASDPEATVSDIVQWISEIEEGTM